MKTKNARLISRGLDGELNPADRERLNALLTSDPKAAATAKSWENLGDHIRREAVGIEIPDSTIAWQDIRRAIRQTEENNEAIRPGTSLIRLRWAGSFAALLVVGALILSTIHLVRDTGSTAWVERETAPRVDWVVAEIPGATTMIYKDIETDMTVIWMDVAQSVDPRDS